VLTEAGFHQLDTYTERLRQEGLNLLILKDNVSIFTSVRDGMQPLLEAIHSLDPATLQGSIVVDKIVGKAAALLISYFGATEVHCGVMSVRAREVLKRYMIKYYAETLLPEIMNRLGTGICPFEATVLDVDEPKKGYECIAQKFKT
jgi:hypothetical protein